MLPAAQPAVLTASQTACLDAVKDGMQTKMMIAIKAKRDLKTAAAALENLRRAQLVRRSSARGWRVTERGQSSAVETIPDPKRRLGGKAAGWIVAGSSAARILQVLDRPMRISEMAARIGVSQVRVRQLTVKLLASGRLRTVDGAKALRLVARIDDPTILLTRDEERALSAMPDHYPTNAARIRTTTALSADRERAALASLKAADLITDSPDASGERRYRLTAAGSAHPQRNPSARRAKPLRLKVESDRVLAVLSHIAESGEARIKDIGYALELPYFSTNALLQYLKRKGLVQKVEGVVNAPYRMTGEGDEVLAEMARRRRS